MIRSRGHASTATAAMFLLVLGACSPEASSPRQTSTDTAVPGRTEASSTAPSVTSSPRTARRAPTPLAAVRPSDLVVRIDALGELCCPAPVAVATVDGRLVTRAADGTLVERRLTAAGVQRLRDEVVGTGLFDRDLEVRLELSPAASPVPHGISARTFRVWNGARTVTVSSPVLQQSEEVFYKPSPARTQLDALAAHLTAPESWLPSTAWAVEAPRAYVADGFRVVSSAEPVGGSPPDVDAIDWPFTTSIADFGEPLAATSQVFVPIGPGTRPLRCAALDANDARSARDAWERAGAKVNDFPDGAFMTVLAWGAGGSGIVLFAQALMPDQSSCGDTY